jgi:hypothetical protein
MSEKIWYRDFPGFLYGDKVFQVLPLHTMSLEGKLNSIVRFFLYLGIILALVRINAKYLFLGIIPALLSYPIYEFEQRERSTAETFLKDNEIDIVDNKACTRSTLENPFMNPSIVDIVYKPDRPEACNIQNKNVQKTINGNFETRVFQDNTDVWGKNYSAREFYTVPSTTIPNKQGEFAEWLYGTGATCKEGNGLECDAKNYRYILR